MNISHINKNNDNYRVQINKHVGGYSNEIIENLPFDICNKLWIKFDDFL